MQAFFLSTEINAGYSATIMSPVETTLDFSRRCHIKFILATQRSQFNLVSINRVK